MKNRTAGGGRLSDIKRQTRAKTRATVFNPFTHTSFQGRENAATLHAKTKMADFIDGLGM